MWEPGPFPRAALKRVQKLEGNRWRVGVVGVNTRSVTFDVCTYRSVKVGTWYAVLPFTEEVVQFIKLLRDATEAPPAALAALMNTPGMHFHSSGAVSVDD